MIKLFINLVEIAVISRVLYKSIKFFMGKKNHKTIPGKIYLLITRKINKRLDEALKKQMNPTTNVVEFKKYRSIK